MKFARNPVNNPEIWAVLLILSTINPGIIITTGNKIAIIHIYFDLFLISFFFEIVPCIISDENTPSKPKTAPEAPAENSIPKAKVIRLPTMPEIRNMTKTLKFPRRSSLRGIAKL